MFGRKAQHERLEFWVTQRSSVILIALIILSLCSFIATLWGTVELVQARFFEGRGLTQARLPEIVVLIVATGILAVVQLALIFSVRIVYSRYHGLFKRLVAVVIYLACLFITAGLGFGFWWKVVEASKETQDSARISVELVDSELGRAVERLNGLNFKLDALRIYSERKAQEERTRGNTCGPSPPMPGPRQRLRDADAYKFGLIRIYVSQKQAVVTANIGKFKGEYAKLRANDPSTLDRSGSLESFVQELNYSLSSAVAGFNELTNDPILKNYRQDLQQRSTQPDFPDGAIRFSCPDAQLSAELNGTIAAIDDLLKVKVFYQKITVSQGAQAVVHALTRLKNTAAAVVFDCRVFFLNSCSLPQSSADIRLRQARGVAGPTEDQAGLSQDDLLPLTLGVIVDILILGFGYFRFRSPQVPAHADEFVAKIDNCFRQAFNRAPTPQERLMPIQASVFNRWSAQYAAIPVDFREYETVSDREQFHAPWMPNQQAGGDVDGEEFRLPSMQEAQYLDYVFNTLRQAGFVRLLSFWSRTLNLLSLHAARKHLENQNSHFANAPALKIYKFHPDAYEVMLDHFMTGEGRKGTKRAGVRGPDLGTRPKDKFPNGYGRDF